MWWIVGLIDDWLHIVHEVRDNFWCCVGWLLVNGNLFWWSLFFWFLRLQDKKTVTWLGILPCRGFWQRRQCLRSQWARLHRADRPRAFLCFKSVGFAMLCNVFWCLLQPKCFVWTWWPRREGASIKNHQQFNQASKALSFRYYCSRNQCLRIKGSLHLPSLGNCVGTICT